MWRRELAVLFWFLVPLTAQAQITINGIPNQVITPTVPAQKSEVYTTTTGFSHTIPDGITLEIINGSLLLATGTITLPANPSDGMPLTLEAPKGVTLATVAPNTGQTLSGVGIATFAVNTPYRLKYAAATATWYPD